MLPFRLQKDFELFAMLLVSESSEKGLFRHLSDHILGSQYFRKYISYEGHPFLANVLNLIEILKMQKIVQRKFFVSEIIVSE